MPKIHLDSILIYIAFVILIILAVIMMVAKVAITVMEQSDVPMYSRPTWPEVTAVETTTIVTTTEEPTEESTDEPEDTGAGLYG